MRRLLLVALALALSAGPALARIKLSSLPERETTLLRIDRPGRPLVEEERRLRLREGVNEVDFSWKGVRIDERSIRIRPLDPSGEVRVLNVAYPPDEDALVWEIASPSARVVDFRISYLLKGVGRRVAYRGLLSEEGDAFALRGDLELANRSGERFEALRIRGLYGVDLERKLADGEIKRMRAFRQEGVPLETHYTWDAKEQPHDPFYEDEAVGIPTHYVFENGEESGLGRFALAPGKIRLFQRDGSGTTAFVGEDRVSFSPVRRPVRVYVGDTRDLKVTRKKVEEERVNVRRNEDGDVVLHDRRERYETSVRSFKEEAAALTILEHWEGEWDFEGRGARSFERKDARTLEVELEIPAGAERTIRYTITHRDLR